MWFKKSKTKPELLTVEDIMLNASAADKWAAIRLVGQRLVDAGHVLPPYMDAMVQRENGFSTYVGNGLAIPHGVGGSQQYIQSSGLAIAQFPGGLAWGDGNVAYLVIGIAGQGEEHMDLLSSIAIRCEDPATVRRLAAVTDPAELLRAFGR